jgi:phosphoglycerol transferase MdoB-like AlkP superfamily enzyme
VTNNVLAHNMTKSHVAVLSPFLAKTFQLVLANLVIFLIYRLLFLSLFSGPAALLQAPAVLLHGLHLDVALLWLELCVLSAVVITTRYLRYRLVFSLLWAFTYINCFSVVVNLLFFRERNQHVWEMLLANLDSPSEILVALAPFIYHHPFALVALLLLTGITVGVAFRHGRILAGHSLDLWRTPLALGSLLVTLGLLYLVSLHSVASKRHGGFHLEVTTSMRHMQFGDFILNQAVINPLYDLIQYYAPSWLTRPRYELDPQQALDLSRKLLSLPPGDVRYPLLRTIRDEVPLGIRNVILVEVEGLGGSILDYRVGGEYLMKYVRELGERGLYFPNIVQSFCATDGSVFATATSLHRTFSLGEQDSTFFPYEINGLYGSLSRILGNQRYRHYFFAGFRQRNMRFVSFMSNQGYETFGFEDLASRLGNRANEEMDLLGVFDGPMLREAAKVILKGQSHFTAHLVTATSHSPWAVPPALKERVEDDRLATFQYVDQSIREFIETLRAQLPDFNHTLFVIIGDHTSVTFGSGYTERIRVPLVLFNTELAKTREQWVDRLNGQGSHVDLLPTILALLEGEQVYSGMGRNLLSAETMASGVISSTHHNSLYLKDGFALEYTPHNRNARLFPIECGEILNRDVSNEHPEIVDQLRTEYLALYETSERLTRERRLLPLTELNLQKSLVADVSAEQTTPGP